VGDLAKCYFPGGHDIKTLDYDEALAETNRLLHGGSDQALSFTQRVDLFAEHYASDAKIPSPVSTNYPGCEFYTKDGEEESGLLSEKKECWKANLGWKDGDFESPTILDVWNFRKKGKLIEARWKCSPDRLCPDTV